MSTNEDNLSLMKVEEIAKLVTDGKIKLNDLIKCIVDSIVPTGSKKPRKPYVTTKRKGLTKEQLKEYSKQYYQEHKAQRAEEYKKNRSIITENQKKYYRLKMLRNCEQEPEEQSTGIFDAVQESAVRSTGRSAVGPIAKQESAGPIAKQESEEK